MRKILLAMLIVFLSVSFFVVLPSKTARATRICDAQGMCTYTNIAPGIYGTDSGVDPYARDPAFASQPAQVGGTQGNSQINVPTFDVAPLDAYTAPEPLGALAEVPNINATAFAVAQQLECGQSSSGGGLQASLIRALEEFGGAAVTQIGNRIGGRAGEFVSRLGNGSSIGSALQSVGGAAAQGLGSVAQVGIQSAIGNACGNSALANLCNAAGSSISRAVGGYVQNVAGRLIQGGLQKLGFGAAGGVLGAVPGASAIAGAVGLGVSVPVTDSGLTTISTATRDNTQGIRSDTATLVRERCVLSPGTRVLAIRALEYDTARTLREANESEARIGNQLEFERAVAETAANQYINETIAATSMCTPEQKEIVQNALTAIITGLSPRTDGGDQSLTCTSSTARVPSFGDFVNRNPNESPSAATAIALGNLEGRIKEAVENAKAATEHGIKADVTCPDGSTTHKVADCPTTYKVVTTAEEKTEQIRQAEGAANEALQNTQFTGTMINALFTDLSLWLDRVGAKGLSNPRASGASGSGSYLDQLSGNVQTESLTSGRNLLIQNITNAVILEADFQTITTGMISNLQSAANIFGDLHACYAALGQSASATFSYTAPGATTPTTITKTEVLTRAENASTTVHAIFAPQITDLNNRILRSQSAVEQLGQALDIATAGQTISEINGAASAFQALADAGLTHTTTEIQFLTNDLNSQAQEIQEINTDANIQLAECRAFQGTSTTI